MGKMARGRGIRVVCGAAEALPLRDGRFDLLLMVTVDCFLDSLREAFLEAHRVLAEGGALVVGLLDGSRPMVQGYMARPDSDGFYREAAFHTPADISRAMDQAGFRELRLVQTLFGAPEDSPGREPVEPGCGQGSFVVVRGSREKGPV
jgi:SAM-dependent methyltransferase